MWPSVGGGDSANGRPTLGLAPLERAGYVSSSVAARVQSRLETELQQAARIDLVEREHVKNHARRARLPAVRRHRSGIGDCDRSASQTSTSCSLAKLLRVGKSHILTLKVVDVRTDEIVWSDDQELGVEDAELVEGSRRIVRRLANAALAFSPVEMILLPAGTLEMGSDAGLVDEQPRHRVQVGAFYLDRTEVSRAAYAPFAKSLGREFSMEIPGDHPVNLVSWHDAEDYCRQLGKRLPTEAEWEYAARSHDGRTYPWGSSPPDARLANFGAAKLGPLAVDVPLAGASEAGALHLAGNVSEWVSDWWDPAYYKSSPEANPGGPTEGEYKSCSRRFVVSLRVRNSRGGAGLSQSAEGVRFCRLPLRPIRERPRPMTCPQVALRRGSDRLVLDGHPWVYSGAIDHNSGGIAPGEIVDVVNFKDRFIGRGYCNPRSNIAVRMLTREPRVIDASFFAAAIDRARQARLQHPSLQSTNAYRLIHGESDGLPGLIVDSYAGFLVVQLHTTGMDRCRDAVVEALNAVVEPRGIYERSDVGTRRADGLNDRPTGLLSGESPPQTIEFCENGVTLQVDVRRGQKTGFFLDQRDNRLLVQKLAGDCSVLDCFAYTGGFSAHALKGGARKRRRARHRPRRGPLRHGQSARQRRRILPLRLRRSPMCFAFSTSAAPRGPHFDLVVLDPPSLLRKSRDIKRATGVYIKLNRNALKLVNSGGLFVTASCSTRVSSEDFLQVVRKAAAGARVTLRILSFNLQPPDHPVDPAFPEGQYLKCIVAFVDR